MIALEAVDINQTDVLDGLPREVVERATELKKVIGVSVGSYTPSKGILGIRREVAAFVERRDGFAVDPECIFLTNGASEGIRRVLEMLFYPGCQDAVLLPVPGYPLYTATLTILGANVIPYYLLEEDQWKVDLRTLERQLDAPNVRAIVLINPGNPTGIVLDYETLVCILRKCAERGVLVLADEVYQENAWSKPFVSARKVAIEQGIDVQIFSFHSTSKGLLGECGRRGGYFECHNIVPEVMEQLLKLASVSLGSNVIGQVMVALMCGGPEKECQERWQRERNKIAEALKSRAKILADSFNALPGVSCCPAEVIHPF